ncbi:radical SAM protein [Polymorphobacter sp.]|uniref:radical SAM protein n=1 Tax=Polymorphobacter sp. TaxID=1909290 RepID=UPI003F723103
MSWQKPYELGLMFTHRCPIACRHCGIESGPHNHATMPQPLALRLIAEAARLDPPPRTLVFTGGEAMMYPDRLEELLEACHDHGLPARVVTNGFWAKDRARGSALIHRLRLAGLDQLNFSADQWHLEFLPAETFRNAVAVARDAGYPIIVNLVLNAPGDPVEHFCALYGYPPDAVRVLDDDPDLAETPPADLFDRINLVPGRLVGMGRAARYPADHLLSPLVDFAALPCAEIVNRPVIYPDGAFQACCCAGGKIAAFTVGNVNDSPLDALFTQMRRRTHYRFINHFGPRALSEVLSGGASLRQPCASICDACVTATAALSAPEVDRRLEHWLIAELARPAPSVPSEA